MANAIEILVCVAVVVAVLLQLFPKLADVAEYALTMVLVSIVAWPLYFVVAWWPQKLPARRALVARTRVPGPQPSPVAVAHR